MTWGDELAKMLDEADGDMGVFCALVALRRTEWGGPGKEFGVLSVAAPHYQDQLEIAANTIRNQERRLQKLPGGQPTRDSFGFFTTAYLKSLSGRYAPIGADNDPKHLNRNHVKNLLAFHTRVQGAMLEAIFGAGNTAAPRES